VFGKCANPHYHGHNYELIVHVTGSIDPATGYVMDMKVLKDLIKEKVEDQMDHKNLNEEVAAFSDLIPTAENMAVVIYNWLKPHIDKKHQLSVTLYETPRNYVSYSG
jgi:6-pyruvoyltetrahydropterin/6-carboxytetrahydropterin synthase